MIPLDFEVTPEEVGLRLDLFVAGRLDGVSRSAVKDAIRRGHVLVAGIPCRRPSRRLRAGEQVRWTAPVTPLLTPQDIPLSILYEDKELVVVDKPAGMVVHPGAGTSGETLVEALLAARTLPVADDPARPGIVHRLDKDTSGVIVVAKTDRALQALKRQFSDRAVTKLYLAQVEGIIAEEEGLIDAPVGRDPAHPRLMTVSPRGRPASTAFRVLKRLSGTSLLCLQPKTGRTHQLRVHLRYIRHPIRGDPLYGKGGERLFLHAWRIALTHPKTGEQMRFTAPVPPWFPPYPYEELPWPDRAARK